MSFVNFFDSDDDLNPSCNVIRSDLGLRGEFDYVVIKDLRPEWPDLRVLLEIRSECRNRSFDINGYLAAEYPGNASAVDSLPWWTGALYSAI
jgi:hypothetical protein